ncbi:MAG: prefoldin subunit alpha [Thermoplasmata archaeon]|nr:MAG: prefoldin subunit alpha [Thermoplasmata archaeon]
MDEKDLQQSLRTLELYRAQLDSLDQQYEFMAVTLRETTKAKETMEAYKEVEEGSEMLTPVGGSSFLFTKASGTNKAIVGIGADIAVETGIDDAIAMLESRIKEVEEAMQSLNSRYSEVTVMASELASKIQGAYNE